MLDKLLWHMKRIFGGITLAYLTEVTREKIFEAKLHFVFLILVPSLNICEDILRRSGIQRAMAWLHYRRALTEDDRSQLFTAAFVSFLFLNISAIVLFSVFMFKNSWLFFSLLQILFFGLLLFNVDYIRNWLGSDDGLRPDKQLTRSDSSSEEFHPLAYYGKVLLFLFYGEFKKLFFGFFWFIVITLLYVMPIYLR